MYRIQSNSKKDIYNFILLRRSQVKLKKTLAVTCEASSEFYIPQYFKPKIKKMCHGIQYFLLIELSLDNWICFHTHS